MQQSKQSIFNVLIHIILLLPMLILVWEAVNGLLGANPVREIQLSTGRTALTLLLISLAGTPAYLITTNRWAQVLRRLIGLYAFFYAGLHLLNFVVIDYGFNFARIGHDIFDKPYALVGLAAFLLLIPLVLTSTTGWQSRLGKNWARLHRLVYPAAVLAIIHLYWSLRVDKGLAIFYGAALILLLLLRLPPLRGKIDRKRERV